MKLNIFSDLRKPGLVPGESLSLAQNYVFCFGETSIYIMANRMRNLHKQTLLSFYKYLKILLERFQQLRYSQAITFLSGKFSDM